MKFSRRRLLQTSLAVGAASVTGGQVNFAQVLASSGSTPVRQITPASGYSAPISELLVRCCDLAGEQYHRSRGDSNYDGNIQSLSEYRNYATQLDRYQQIQSFQLLQPSFRPSTTLGLNAFGVNNVLWGYALTSRTSNIIALRGTQTEAEMALGTNFVQVAFGSRSSRVHGGFYLIYQGLIGQLRQAAEQFNPDLPCYITGYSLGGAVAVLAAATLAEGQLKSQLQVYTYAMPRVGNPAFAERYNRLVPQTYRIVNQADLVPTLPPNQIQGSTYADVGEPWFYFSQCGNFDRNHAIKTYRLAVDNGLQQSPQAEPSNNCS
jgi:triacylglycerol lipase